MAQYKQLTCQFGAKWAEDSDRPHWGGSRAACAIFGGARHVPPHQLCGYLCTIPVRRKIARGV